MKDWQEVQYLVIPDGLMLGDVGACLVLAGMRRSQTLIDEDGLWFQENDGTREYVSLKVDSQGLDKLLATDDASAEDRFLEIPCWLEPSATSG